LRWVSKVLAALGRADGAEAAFGHVDHSSKETITMRVSPLIMTVAAAATLFIAAPGRADEYSKLTTLTFSKTVQLPGLTLEPGRYRFEVADPVESRRVIKVSNADGTKQLALLPTISREMRDSAKDPLVLFGESAAGRPDAVKAWAYPGERIAFEFIYPHDQAARLSKTYHTSVLSKTGETIERVNEDGTTSRPR
jgi:hypothetical protein